MSGLEIAFGIVLMVFAVGIIAIVLLQEGQQKNNSVITGGLFRHLPVEASRTFH